MDPGALRVQEQSAKVGSVLALVAAVLPLALGLKDVLLGGADGVYKDNY